MFPSAFPHRPSAFTTQHRLTSTKGYFDQTLARTVTVMVKLCNTLRGRTAQGHANVTVHRVLLGKLHAIVWRGSLARNLICTEEQPRATKRTERRKGLMSLVKVGTGSRITRPQPRSFIIQWPT